MSKASKNTSHRKLYTVGGDAPFQFVEAYKSLRTNLEFLSSAGNCKTILITSSVPEEGKSNVALNLAMTLTASGNRVVLVDCDLRKATISRYLRIPRNHTGLTNVITSKDEGALAAALVRVKDSGITVLTAGTIPPNPTELLSTPMTEKIFASLQKAFDYVIIDTPPVSVVTDAAVLCGIADGVLLVVDKRVSSRLVEPRRHHHSERPAQQKEPGGRQRPHSGCCHERLQWHAEWPPRRLLLRLLLQLLRRR